ncbi:peptidylprolyl isomerase [Thalassolituus sp. LLYu03]|uniref:peptidylprolyl isomerase n=1 Tax=Thalassolituus sp. LLYu03 TaxID=3421656 RepID=UPI003D2AC2F6
MKYTALFLTVALTACGNGDYLAKVGDHKVSKGEFSSYLAMKGIESDANGNVLKDLANRIALVESISTEGLLDKAGIDASVEDYRRNLMINQYFDKFMTTHVTDEAVKNYFSSHAADYEEERVHIAHILVRTNSSMTEEENQQAKTRIYDVYSRLQANGDFAELAASYSTDTLSAKKGGDLGWLKRGSVSPVFTQTAFGLKEGAYSEPVQTEFGFHILKALESPKVIKKSFDEVKGEIRHMLKAQAKQAELDRLLATTDVEIYSDK